MRPGTTCGTCQGMAVMLPRLMGAVVGLVVSGMAVTVLLIVSVVISACTAEGNSQFIGKGETRYFLSMSACEREAVSEYEGGGRKYSGFECRQMFLGLFQLESKTY